MSPFEANQQIYNTFTPLYALYLERAYKLTSSKESICTSVGIRELTKVE
ncbi:hypothetical protein AM1_D0133 (plasmid) [Acaryochloris marina MBIC11017]|uniref:Uncharacterized protein n=1 Tax=Acaryochloris marina (strain MBIC 11017) TaxID=329726 RepID=A8ZNP2_ACAM1|nr:hypothetical protein AM1_D0133 [Acaryochloris marina MBIC11017]